MKVLLTGSIIACMAGGYTTSKISTHKKLIHSVVTGLILTFLYALVNDFEFDLRFPDIGIAYFGFLPVTIIGAMIFIRNKKIIQNIHSSPPDIPLQ